MLTGLDLFSGIGGLTIALSEWVRPVAYCEIEPYAAGVLFSRMSDGSIPVAPVWPDVTTLRGHFLPSIDVIYGGFPCQDVSLAGARKGLEGERTGLFFEIVRLARECRPTFVFLENVPGIKPYRKQIHTAFKELGYECRDGTLAAAYVGACHIRNRWWFLAYTDKNRRRIMHTGKQELGAERQGKADIKHNGAAGNNADSNEKRLQIAEQEEGTSKTTGIRTRTTSISWRITQSPVCRADDGIPNRVDRIKALGNSVVPQCAKEAFKRLMGLA